MTLSAGPATLRLMAKNRSPNFPAIPLQRAVERAREVYVQENRHPAAPETIVGHWGYSATSSGGRQTIGALRAFGLLEDAGKTRGQLLRLTDRARQILLHEANSTEWLALVREAALLPTIHSELWQMYGGELPSDQNLHRHLVLDRDFSDGGARELIREMRATFDFARLRPDYGDTLSEDEPDNSEDEEETQTVTASPTAPLSGAPARVPTVTAGNGPAPIQIPLIGGTVVTLTATGPVSESAWEQMMTVFTALKSGFVSKADTSRDDGDDD